MAPLGSLRAFRTPRASAHDVLQRCWQAGDAAVLLDPSAPDAVVTATCRRLRPAELVDVDTDGRAVRRTRFDDGEPVDDGIALVVATSGSTGEPKGVELTHTALASSVRAGLARLGARDGERWALALPTHHVAGVLVLLRAAALGTPAVTVDSTAELATVDAEHLALVPTQLTALIEAGVDVSRFRSILLGGAPAPPGLLEAAARAGARVVTSYGMSETCGGCVYDGDPLDGVELDVDPRGRIRVRGDVLFSRYRRDPAATSAAFGPDGWFTTGDVGGFTTEGGSRRLVVAGRADDVAVSGGENVPLAAVTAVLAAHPRVDDVVVTSRPHPRWGEEVVAVVVGDVTLAELRERVRDRLPAAWAPRAVTVTGALPRDAMGKLAASEVADLAAAAIPRV